MREEFALAAASHQNSKTLPLESRLGSVVLLNSCSLSLTERVEMNICVLNKRVINLLSKLLSLSAHTSAIEGLLLSQIHTRNAPNSARFEYKLIFRVMLSLCAESSLSGTKLKFSPPV